MDVQRSLPCLKEEVDTLKHFCKHTIAFSYPAEMVRCDAISNCDSNSWLQVVFIFSPLQFVRSRQYHVLNMPCSLLSTSEHQKLETQDIALIKNLVILMHRISRHKKKR